MPQNCVEFALAHPSKAPRIMAGITAARAVLGDGKLHRKSDVVAAITATGLALSTANNILRCGRQVSPPLWTREGSHQRPYYRNGGPGRVHKSRTSKTVSGRVNKSRTSKAVKVHDLYPLGGGFTTLSRHYHGTIYSVVAESSVRALALANERRPIDPTDERPNGVLSVYRRDVGHTLSWCGCTTFEWTRPSHGSGVRAIRAAIDKHMRTAHGR